MPNSRKFSMNGGTSLDALDSIHHGTLPSQANRGVGRQVGNTKLRWLSLNRLSISTSSASHQLNCDGTDTLTRLHRAPPG